MRVERIVEARQTVLHLSAEQADALAVVGRRLASQERWWGEPNDEALQRTRSIIECEPYGQGRWRVRVHNAVGVINVPGLHIVVEPKIPLEHLMHLFIRSGAFPQVDTSMADLASADSLWPLVASWYISALERLIRSGLSNGYRSTRGELPSVRGRLLTAPTVAAFYKGRISLHCEYEEFDADTPLNRTLKGAAAAVRASEVLSSELRHRARRSLDQMQGVGTFRSEDATLSMAESHTRRYSVVLQLAKHVLASVGRGLDVGNHPGYSFLIKTPSLVEDGLRNIIREALSGEVPVVKRTRQLSGSHHSLTPDLCFGTRAVGDVKYKVWDGDWNRADLYQLAAFATGFESDQGLRVGFSSNPHGSSPVQVGRVKLTTCDWIFNSTTPELAEETIQVEVRGWWQQIQTG